jgi:hypothetical protein
MESPAPSENQAQIAAPQLSLRAEKLIADVANAAAVAGAAFSPAQVKPVVAAFEEFFIESAISFRTTTKKVGARALNFRYVELARPHDALAIAHRHALLPRGSGTAESALLAIQGDFPILGYGVDVGADFGLEKIWSFFPHRPWPAPMVADLPYMPNAVRTYLPFFQRFQLDLVSLLGIDFRSQTVNLYFMQRPGLYAAADVSAMFSELGFEVPTPALLDLCRRAVPVYCTYSWDSDAVQRLCFGIPFKDGAKPPSGMDSVIDRYVEHAPFASGGRSFILSVTANATGCFVKIENDYNGKMIALMEAPQHGGDESFGSSRGEAG